MNSVFLKDLFNSLEKDKVNYLVLRGYQDLPEKYGHDIDFSVINESELTSFFNVIHDLSKKYKLQLIPFLLEGVAQKPEFNLSDGMHPNDQGTIIIGNTIKKAILKNL